MGRWGLHGLAWGQRSQDKLWEFPTNYHVGTRDWTQAIRLGGKHLCPLSQLTDPQLTSFPLPHPSPTTKQRQLTACCCLSLPSLSFYHWDFPSSRGSSNLYFTLYSFSFKTHTNCILFCNHYDNIWLDFILNIILGIQAQHPVDLAVVSSLNYLLVGWIKSSGRFYRRLRASWAFWALAYLRMYLSDRRLAAWLHT